MNFPEFQKLARFLQDSCKVFNPGELFFTDFAFVICLINNNLFKRCFIIWIVLYNSTFLDFKLMGILSAFYRNRKKVNTIFCNIVKINSWFFCHSMKELKT